FPDDEAIRRCSGTKICFDNLRIWTNEGLRRTLAAGQHQLNTAAPLVLKPTVSVEKPTGAHGTLSHHTKPEDYGET
ncbi:hypothetical protein, partial [Paracoccus denitrificans]|uniref:hypothetical protein n=1 Tax=Paracoccus denitrificans TaxID=266 RepID=UPI001C990A91